MSKENEVGLTAQEAMDTLYDALETLFNGKGSRDQRQHDHVLKAFQDAIERKKPVKEASWKTDKEGNVIPPANAANPEQALRQIEFNLSGAGNASPIKSSKPIQGMFPGGEAEYTGPDTLESLARRVEKLEQEWRVAERRKDGGVTFMHSRIIELADAMNEAGLAVGDHSRHAQMEERLKKLEEQLTEPHTRSGRPVHERTIWIHPFDIPRFKCKAQRVDYMTAFDPDASPSGAPFEVALMYAKLGRRISRKHDPRKDVMWVEGETVMTSHRHYYVSDEDLLADDWMVLPKEKGG